MKEKGFVLDNYKKRMRHCRTGYCFAHHKNCEVQDKKKEIKPIALLNMPNTCFLNETIVINVQDSFVLNDIKSELSYL